MSPKDASWGGRLAWRGSNPPPPPDTPKPGPCCQAGLTLANPGWVQNRSRSAEVPAGPGPFQARGRDESGQGNDGRRSGSSTPCRQGAPSAAHGHPGRYLPPARSSRAFGRYRVPRRPSPPGSQPDPTSRRRRSSAWEGVTRAKAATPGEPRPGKLVHPRRRRRGVGSSATGSPGDGHVPREPRYKPGLAPPTAQAWSAAGLRQAENVHSSCLQCQPGRGGRGSHRTLPLKPSSSSMMV